MKPLILIGGGGHCRSCIDVIESEGTYQIVGIIERENARAVSTIDYELLGTDGDLPSLVAQYRSAVVTVGQIKSPEIRIRLFQTLQVLSANIPVIVSPHAYVSRYAQISAGTFVMHGAFVNAKADICENCIINSQALIEHDVTIESHCHISTGAKINGHAYIETGTFIGSGAVIKEGVRIGSQCIVGAGTVVLRDLPPGTIFRGKA
jgi:sugar O-acyltransferase (sialic acid O-acetyltransferase NeuD family)